MVKDSKGTAGRFETLAAEHKKDNTLTFERNFGVDRLLVDEAHYFKNLFYVTKMTRVAGLPQTASERAFDMFLKVRHVQSLNRRKKRFSPQYDPAHVKAVSVDMVVLTIGQAATQAGLSVRR